MKHWVDGAVGRAIVSEYQDPPVSQLEYADAIDDIVDKVLIGLTHDDRVFDSHETTSSSDSTVLISDATQRTFGPLTIDIAHSTHPGKSDVLYTMTITPVEPPIIDVCGRTLQPVALAFT